MHHVVAGALLGPEGVLLAHRSPSKAYYPDCWDFPGGHIEPGESPVEALHRELREELGIDARVEGPAALRIAEGLERADGMILDIWAVTRWRGEPTNAAPEEHDDLRWFARDRCGGLKLAHPDYGPLLTRLLGTARAAP